MKDKKVIVETNIAVAALSLTLILKTPALCTITDNTNTWDMGAIRHVKRNINTGSKYCDTGENLKK